jgi:hypothetical protein
MNFKSILRMNAILIGLGAIVLLAPSVRAQQDMDPDSFADGPGMAPMAQPTPLAITSPEMDTEVAYDTAQAAEISGQASALEASLAQWTPALTWTLLSLLVCCGLVYLHCLAEIKRDTRYWNSRQIS